MIRFHMTRLMTRLCKYHRSRHSQVLGPCSEASKTQHTHRGSAGFLCCVLTSSGPMSRFVSKKKTATGLFKKEGGLAEDQLPYQGSEPLACSAKNIEDRV